MFKFRKPRLRISKKGKISFSGGGVSVGGKQARVNLSKSGTSVSSGVGPAHYNSRRGWSFGLGRGRQQRTGVSAGRRGRSLGCAALLIVIILTLVVFSVGSALADTYDIPVITGGKVITITVEVEGSSPITVSTASKGVLLGKPKARTEEIVQSEPVSQPGQWAKLRPDALDRVDVTKDKFSGNTFYVGKVDVSPQKGAIYPYVGTDGKKRWFRLITALATDKIDIFRNATFLVDGEKFDITFDALGVEHKYLANGLYLFMVDTKLESEEFAMLQAIASAKSVSVRFYTRNSWYDYELGEDEQNAFADALAVYEIIGGKMNDTE